MRFERRLRSRQRTLKQGSALEPFLQIPLHHVLLGRKSEPNSMAMYKGSWKANRQQQCSHPRTSAQLKTLMTRKKQQRLKLILYHQNSGSVFHSINACMDSTETGGSLPVNQLITDTIAVTPHRIAFREESKNCTESSQNSYTRPRHGSVSMRKVIINKVYRPLTFAKLPQ